MLDPEVCEIPSSNLFKSCDEQSALCLLQKGKHPYIISEITKGSAAR